MSLSWHNNRFGYYMNDSISIGVFGNDVETIRRERADAASNRRLILSTAASLFEEKGVTAVTMADIAQAAGVGKGTLYRRFSNKADICLALMDEQMRAFQNERLADMRQMQAQGVPPLVILDRFMGALVQFTSVHIPLLCEVQREGLLEETTQFERPYFWQYMSIKGLLVEAQKLGVLHLDFDTAYAADALLAPLRSDLFQYQHEVRGFSIERISAGLRSIVSGLANSSGLSLAD